MAVVVWDVVRVSVIAKSGVRIDRMSIEKLKEQAVNGDAPGGARAQVGCHLGS